MCRRMKLMWSCHWALIFYLMIFCSDWLLKISLYHWLVKMCNYTCYLIECLIVWQVWILKLVLKMVLGISLNFENSFEIFLLSFETTYMLNFVEFTGLFSSCSFSVNSHDSFGLKRGAGHLISGRTDSFIISFELKQLVCINNFEFQV